LTVTAGLLLCVSLFEKNQVRKARRKSVGIGRGRAAVTGYHVISLLRKT